MICGLPFVMVQRLVHREIQLFLFILTRRHDLSLVLFSLIFFPGVALHELSHYLVALLLGVRTGRISLMPRTMPDGRLQLGYVETAPTDWLREGFIGAAPLLIGGGFVAFAGLNLLGLRAVWDMFQIQGVSGIALQLSQVSSRQDFWLWLYLALAVSSTMLPSPSDQRTWLPLSILVLLLLMISLLAGLGPWLLENLGQPLDYALTSIAVVFAISLILHLLLFLPLRLIRLLFSRFSIFSWYKQA